MAATRSGSFPSAVTVRRKALEGSVDGPHIKICRPLAQRSRGAVLRLQVQGQSTSPEQDGGHGRGGMTLSLRDLVPDVAHPFFPLHWLHEGREMWPQTQANMDIVFYCGTKNE